MLREVVLKTVTLIVITGLTFYSISLLLDVLSVITSTLAALGCAVLIPVLFYVAYKLIVHFFKLINE